MTGGRSGLGGVRGTVALAFVAMALLLRVMIPQGFMPAIGQGFAVTLCTGAGATSAWVDERGQVHKGKPLESEGGGHPCAFAGFGGALDLPGLADGAAAPFPAYSGPAAIAVSAAAIGRGLAAPPPPSTGPPAAP